MKTLFSGLLLAASLSFAAPTTYNNYADWAAPGSLGVTINFDAIAAQDNSQLISTGGFTFTGTTDEYIRIYTTAFAQANLNGSRSLTGPTGVLNIALPSDIFGIGFYIGSPASTVSIFVNGQIPAQSIITTVTPPVSSGTATFWGIRSDVAITSIQLVSSQGGYRTVIDDLQVAGAVTNGGGGNEPPPSETPEASSAILIGTSLILLPLARKYALRHNA